MSTPPEFATSMIGDSVSLGLIESLRFAVPLAILELSRVPRDPQGVDHWALRRVVPDLGMHATELMFTDALPAQDRAPQRTSRQLNKFTLAHNALVKGLAVLALDTPAGVTFAGLHWCVSEHDDCPNPPRKPVEPVTPERIARVVGMLAEFREMCGLPPVQPQAAATPVRRKKPKPVPAPVEVAPRRPVQDVIPGVTSEWTDAL